MPRRRRNRNQKRRTVGGATGDACDGGRLSDGDNEEAARPAEGLRGQVLTERIINDNLQTTVARLGTHDSERSNAERKNHNEGPNNEINGKINTLINSVLMSTPRIETPSVCETNILNNMTPKRNLRGVRNESYIDNLCTNSSTVLLKSNRQYKFRSNSSTSKLRSPGVEKTPITVDASTQTVKLDCLKEESLHLESCVNIFETPKISQNDLLRTPKRIDIEKLNFKPLNLNRIRYKKLKNFSEIITGEIDLKNDAELSFQNFIDRNDVSTPIEKNFNDKQLIRSNNKNSIVNHRSKEKVKVKKFEASLVTKRRCKISPRKVREAPPIFELKKRKDEKATVPKSFATRLSRCKATENILNVSSDTGRFFTRAKRFHTRFVSRWIARISEICSWLGLTLKKTLSPVTTKDHPKMTWTNPIHHHLAITVKNQSIKTPSTAPCGNCEEYRMKMIVLSSKIEVLERELNRSTAESKETIATLMEEITRIKSELSEIDVIKKQLKELEEMVKLKSFGVLTTAPPPPPPPPCMPVPPPIPPPMLNLNLDVPVARPKSGGGGNKKRLERKTNENSRPVISLDDILNVKLKKTTDKPLSARRAQQPLISVEMLNQIKLRPTSRPETPCSFREASSNISTLPSSPASSLSKILSNVDTNVRKIKRLRRPNGYSLDDFSRRRVLRREWSGSDDT